MKRVIKANTVISGGTYYGYPDINYDRDNHVISYRGYEIDERRLEDLVRKGILWNFDREMGEFSEYMKANIHSILYSIIRNPESDHFNVIISKPVNASEDWTHKLGSVSPMRRIDDMIDAGTFWEDIEDYISELVDMGMSTSEEQSLKKYARTHYDEAVNAKNIKRGK